MDRPAPSDAVHLQVDLLVKRGLVDIVGVAALVGASRSADTPLK
jgi:hypothetical protein